MMRFVMVADTTEFEVVVADGDNVVLRSEFASLRSNMKYKMFVSR